MKKRKKKQNYTKVENMKRKRRKKPRYSRNVIMTVNSLIHQINVKSAVKQSTSLILAVKDFVLIIARICHRMNLMHIDINSIIIERKEYVAIHVGMICLFSELMEFYTVNMNVMDQFIKTIFFHIIENVYQNVR